MKATAPRLTGGVGDDSVRTVRRSAAWHEWLAGDQSGGDGRGQSASVARRTCVVESGQRRSAMRVARRSAARCRNTSRRRRGQEVAVRTPTRGPDSAFKARRVARAHGSHVAMARSQAGPAREAAADSWAPHVSDF
jgi:hypothetical protein